MSASRRIRSKVGRPLMEALEGRALLSASVAVFTMQAPAGVAMVQTDVSATPGAASGPTATFNSALDITVRTLAGGVQIMVAASSTEVMALAPSGSVDIYDNLQYVGSVELGKTMRSTLVLPAGRHEFQATYSGDARFLPSQASVTRNLALPTSTPHESVTALTAPETVAGKRVRPTRLLSKIDYFAERNLAVAALPTLPSGTGGGPVAVTPAISVPAVRFAKLSFSLKLPKALVAMKVG